MRAALYSAGVVARILCDLIVSDTQYFVVAAHPQCATVFKDIPSSLPSCMLGYILYQCANTMATGKLSLSQ